MRGYLSKMDAFTTIKHPLATEKVIRLMDSDNVLCFVSDECCISEELILPISEIYNNYEEWCKRGKKIACAINNFSPRVIAFYKGKVTAARTNKDRFLKGIGWNTKF